MQLIEPAGRQILVVDDDPTVGAALEQILKHEGYHVTRARDGRGAIKVVDASPPDLILLDLNMPNMGGFEVCKRIKGNPATTLLPIVIVTGESEFDARMQAWEVGADDFLTKPFQLVEVLARCRSLLRTKQLIDELDSAQSVLFAFARTLEAKSRYTQGHSERVTRHALWLAERVGVPATERETLRRGSLLHDIGKISIPDAVLDKPARLTPEEYAVVKRHPEEGVRMVESLRSIRDVIPHIRWHHERMDGGGYPDGLFAANIPLAVRVLSVADVYDALATERPYRPALAIDECFRIMHADAAGGGLDPELVKEFCADPPIPEQGPIPATAAAL
ncbi:MAG TPA: HD domain-containing phosphohydrolase [Gemmataceae bacterium]|jgi:putative two-component system response regulator|nr:HD domain-containing phosphohydrolase [Gemmataceae bacterium]